jgi:hypothetical protein
MMGQSLDRRLEKMEAALLFGQRPQNIVFFTGPVENPEELFKDNACTVPLDPAELEAMRERGAVVFLPPNGRDEIPAEGPIYFLPEKEQDPNKEVR